MNTKHAACWLALLTGLSYMAAHAAGQPDDVRLLMSSPQCPAERLGQISVTLGSKEPDPRTGMAPSGVSYKKAFARLAKEAAAKGGNAVVLRGHQADYYTKGARRPTRPTYISLQGAVILLSGDLDRCPMKVIDPTEFERSSKAGPRAEVVEDPH